MIWSSNEKRNKNLTIHFNDGVSNLDLFESHCYVVLFFEEAQRVLKIETFMLSFYLSFSSRKLSIEGKWERDQSKDKRKEELVKSILNRGVYCPPNHFVLVFCLNYTFGQPDVFITCLYIIILNLNGSYIKINQFLLVIHTI